MDLIHPDFPGRRLRLAYCNNLHAAEDLPTALANMRAVTLPLRDRLAGGRPFGVGMYLPAGLAGTLASEGGEELRRTLDHFLRDEGLLPFTYNAFPYGGFQSDGLKASVYRPTWSEDDRILYTHQVAQVAQALARGRDLPRVSISTHPGGFGAWEEGGPDNERYADGLARAATLLEEIEREAEGLEFVLSIEAEPRASCGDGKELAAFLPAARSVAAERLMGGRSAAIRLLGTCLDACHAAVEFEEPAEALALASNSDTTLGKIQFSSALALEEPGQHPESVQLLLDLDEPRFLHQVTGRGSTGLLQVTDLPDLAVALAGPDRDAWLACDEWRCHFHVPVDRDRLATEAAGLSTTRTFADDLLVAALHDPTTWSSQELHVEIETYTWSILPGPARGPGDLVDGLEREYRHVLALAAHHGWHPS